MAFPKFSPHLDVLAENESNLRHVCQFMGENHAGSFKFVDLFIVGAVGRSLKLSSGFRALLQRFNFNSAAPLIRLQIDTVIRLHAITLVRDPQHFAEQIILGKAQFNHLKDRDGNQLTDAHLLRSMAPRFPWIKTVYDKASGFVHFSVMHFYTYADNSRFVSVGDTDDLPDDRYIDAIQTFNKSFFVLMHYVDVWVKHYASDMRFEVKEVFA